MVGWDGAVPVPVPVLLLLLMMSFWCDDDKEYHNDDNKDNRNEELLEQKFLTTMGVLLTFKYTLPLKGCPMTKRYIFYMTIHQLAVKCMTQDQHRTRKTNRNTSM